MTVDIFGKLYPNIAYAEIPHQEAKNLSKFLMPRKVFLGFLMPKMIHEGLGKYFFPGMSTVM